MFDKPRVRSNTRKEERERRLPIGDSRLRLYTPELEGFHLHWVFDRDNRPSIFTEMGYEFVSTEEIPGVGEARNTEQNDGLGSRIEVTSGSGRLVLMKIKNEWYEENQKVKQAELDETDRQLKEGSLYGVEQQYGRIKVG